MAIYLNMKKREKKQQTEDEYKCVTA